MHAAMVPVGIAVVGAGPWGATLARAFARLNTVKLRWICELDDERRARAGEAHPDVHATPYLDEIVADPQVAAVAVAVDSPQHRAVGMRVLEAGRHLFLEKPMALLASHAAELAAAATARRRVLTVGHLLLHHPAIRRARQMLDDGIIGAPLYLEARRVTAGPPRRPGSVWWTLAPHDVSLALHLFRALPKTVIAVGGAWGAAGEDNVSTATLVFDDGRSAHIHVARFAAHKQRHMSVAGTRATLAFDELAEERPLRLHVHRRAIEVVPVDCVEPLLAQSQHFAACVARGDATGGNASHGEAVVRVLEAGARSMAAHGEPIEVA
jgi:predicted dehydrogenase